MILHFLKKDNFLAGLLLGIVLPIVFYGVVLLIDILLFQFLQIHLTSQHHYMYLLSAAINLIPIRYYLVTLKAEKSGIGVLLITGIYILTYFFMFYKQ